MIAGKMRGFLKTIPWLLAALPVVSLALAAPPRPAARTTDGGFTKTVKPLLARHCVACHNPKSKQGGLNLQALGTPAALASHRHQWEQVAEKLRTGEMPPPGSPRPDAGQVQAATHWLAAEFERQDRLAPPQPGRVTARRLNRAEYDNTVRDLLAVQFRPADDFPQDDSGYGFDNIGDVLSLSPVLMEKYLAAAEKVARTALFGPERLKPTLLRFRPDGGRVLPSPKPLTDYDLTGLTMPNALHLSHRVPVEGEYTVRAVLSGDRPLASEPLSVALWVDGRQVETREVDPAKTASFEIDRQTLSGKTADFRVRLAPGEHWIAASVLRLYEGLPPSYAGPNPSKRPTPPPPDFSRFFQPPPNATPEQLADFQRRLEERRMRLAQRQMETVPANVARIGSMEIGGPYEQPTGPSDASLRKVFTCGHLKGGHSAGCAERIVGAFLRRAFRRPVPAKEAAPYVGLVKTAQKAGDSFEEGICLALQAALVSPHFLFRIERDPKPGTVHALGDHELATRLSYFLWSSTPDDELLALADRKELSRPEVLSAQVKRLLKDPRARALVENFAGQWLELRKLESVKPDTERFPQFDGYLRLSMRQETERFFEQVIRADRPILDFIDADYTFLNERLARFYGIAGVTGPEFRKVSLAGTNRGGVLTQASVLTVSSYSTRTSPVLRGKWILENVLNSPPPPPPPDVPNLDETKVGTSVSLRQQLEIHRTNPTCASCHARLDPLGFGLENFDAIGAWRESDGSLPIDPSASLPDGRSFKGPGELKGILREDRDAFTRCVAEKLLTYALGRGLEAYDRRTVKSIAEGVAASDYRFSSLVTEIVKSVPFRMRKGEPIR